MVFQYVCNNAGKLHIDVDTLKRFLRRMHDVDNDVTTHNSNYVEDVLQREASYFDNILKDIDPVIKLDEEQRRAVITDDDYCLLVAGAGAGKTTTMAAKVKYLVEKKHINPEEIIVISYTNKAIGELRERINKRLNIPAKICTFHAFAFEIVKRFSVDTTFDTNLIDRRWARCYDSTIHLHVTIHESGYDTTFVNACDSFYWNMNKRTYYKTPTTNPTYAFASDQYNCDSIYANLFTTLFGAS